MTERPTINDQFIRVGSAGVVLLLALATTIRDVGQFDVVAGAIALIPVVLLFGGAALAYLIFEPRGAALLLSAGLFLLVLAVPLVVWFVLLGDMGGARWNPSYVAFGLGVGLIAAAATRKFARVARADD